MTDHKLVELIRSVVTLAPKPCVNISGGIDSTIVLHHLRKLTDEPIYTYTVGFEDTATEFENAERVADWYGTKHRNILIRDMLKTYPTILPYFPRPRFNLWPYWAAMQAKQDGRESCYIGEGGDEHFGGYWYKPPASYISHWHNFFTYVHPTYRTIYEDIAHMRLVTPMHPNYLDWQQTFPYYDDHQEKAHLRKAYTGVLPDFVVTRRKHNGRFDYWTIWREQLEPFFDGETPQTEDDIRLLLNEWVTREWLKTR